MNEQMDVAAVDEVFSGREQLTPAKPDREIITVPLDELYPFPGHPFRVMMDADMERLVTSIRNNGVLVPAIVRPRRQGGYEIIAGHRRKEASRQAGKPTMPVEVHREMDEDAATMAMIETNMKVRSKLLPSERAWAYRMMRDALIHRGVMQEDGKTTKQQIAEHFGESASNVTRMIRLTMLNRDLLDLVDSGKLKLGLAVQISFLDTEAQSWISDHLEQNGAFPSAAQIREIRELFDQGKLTQDAFTEVMSQEQPAKQSAQRDDFVAAIRDEHFPNLTIEDVKEKLLELIEQYHHKKRMEM